MLTINSELRLRIKAAMFKKVTYKIGKIGTQQVLINRLDKTRVGRKARERKALEGTETKRWEIRIRDRMQ